ncbi:MAG TPA: hemolysin [Firmicutes bacterium]|jgi:CBS domain containing-hemolysin-like protein|nr:hemolysin [Bacillota bacterium]
MLGQFITWLLWLVSFFLVAFFAASETAFIRLDNLTVKQLVSRKAKGAEIVEQLLEARQPLLSSLLVGTNLAVVLTTVLATMLMRDVHVAGVSGSTISTWGMIVLILLFGEILPKRMASAHTVSFALKAARPIQLSYRVFAPLATPLLKIPQMLSRQLQIEADDTSIDEESLLTLVDMGEEEGAVEEEERDMIVGVLESNHTLAREVMTPRVDMITIAIDDSAEEIWQQIIASGLSRIPVYEETVDNIVGVLYAKDLLEYGDSQQPLVIANLMREAYFVPETKRINDLLRELKSLHIHMAIVIDEYGGTAGLVTIEDLLEEIVGEIQDEFDDDEEAEIQQLGTNTWLVDGAVPIDEISELVEVDLPDEEVDTIGGFVYWILDHIPDNGELLDLPDYGLKITVAKINGRRIAKLKIEVLDNQ